MIKGTRDWKNAKIIKAVGGPRQILTPGSHRKPTPVQNTQKLEMYSDGRRTYVIKKF